jgi:transmembrane sensor
MNKDQFLILLQRYLHGTATSEETAFLHAYYNVFITDNDVINLLNGHEKEKLKLSIRAGIQKEIAQKGRTKKIQIRALIAAAATVIIVLSFSLYFFKPKSKPQDAPGLSAIVKIPPGSNKAVLTLHDGRQISVTDARHGQLVVEGNMAINKTADGELNYQNGGRPANTPAMFNTLTTPRGGQYQMTLSDGTKVWLNAASSIRYPVSFAGSSKREVEITGEVYFEVVHDVHQPFRVISNGMEIEDLGTEFNVNAYNDEPVIRTSLVEGSIKISKGGRAIIMEPGMEATIKTGESLIKVGPGDIEEAVAWRNGQTIFTNQNIQTIMRQVSRWYDVDVIYEGALTDRRFDGGISRKSDLSAVLKILQLNHIHFKMNGRQIIIKPYN